MKIFGRILLVLVLVVLVAVSVAYVDGRSLPVDHSVYVVATIAAPPDKVFARIVDYAHGADWRPEVKSVTVLPSDNGKDHWIEDVGHGQTMTFLAIHTEAPTLRVVKLDDPHAAYGGTWTYQMGQGPTPDQTVIQITETGYINPPLYRFMMAHVMGPTYNLEHYIADLKAAATHP